MFDLGVIATLMLGETWAARRAVWGRAPARQMRLSTLAMGCAAIHLGFHAAATAAPSAGTAIALVLAGWTSFALWWVWLSRAPAPRRNDGPEGGGGSSGGGSDGSSGGGGGGGPDRDRPDDPTGGGGVDWEALERQFDDVDVSPLDPAPA